MSIWPTSRIKSDITTTAPWALVGPEDPVKIFLLLGATLPNKSSTRVVINPSFSELIGFLFVW